MVETTEMIGRRIEGRPTARVIRFDAPSLWPVWDWTAALMAHVDGQMMVDEAEELRRSLVSRTRAAERRSRTDRGVRHTI